MSIALELTKTAPSRAAAGGGEGGLVPTKEFQEIHEGMQDMKDMLKELQLEMTSLRSGQEALRANQQEFAASVTRGSEATGALMPAQTVGIPSPCANGARGGPGGVA